MDNGKLGLSSSDLLEMAKQIKIVRNTGATNMFDRVNVCKILDMLCYNDTATMFRENKSLYISVLRLSVKV